MTLEGTLFLALAYGLPILGAILGTGMAIACRIQNGHWR